MNWEFVNINILEEKNSGYKIHLLSGTWFHPGKLKPESSHKIDFNEELTLLRSGLGYIQSIGLDSNKTRQDVC